MLDLNGSEGHSKAMDASQQQDGLSFEDALRRLEEIVRTLEKGEAPLDQSIELYERGQAPRAHCQARLDAAQARIEKIVASPDGRASHSVPFDSDG